MSELGCSRSRGAPCESTVKREGENERSRCQFHRTAVVFSPRLGARLPRSRTRHGLRDWGGLSTNYLYGGRVHGRGTGDSLCPGLLRNGIVQWEGPLGLNTRTRECETENDFASLVGIA